MFLFLLLSTMPHTTPSPPSKKPPPQEASSLSKSPTNLNVEAFFNRKALKELTGSDSMKQAPFEKLNAVLLLGHS